MVKFMVCVVFATMLNSMCFAQSTTDIKSVKAVENSDKTQKFYANTETGSVEISPLVYKVVEACPNDFIVVQVGEVKTLFARVDFSTPTQYVFEVEKVTLENDEPTVVMTNGFKFSDEDLAWLTVQPGQHVQVSRYIGLTREITVLETVSRDVPLTGDAESAQTPAKSKLPQMIETIKAQKRERALAMNSSASVEQTASTPIDAKSIRFIRR